MREEEIKRIHETYKKLNIEIPYNKINDLISKSYTVVDTISLEYFQYSKLQNMDTEISSFLYNLKKSHNEINSWSGEYKNGCLQIQNIHRNMKQRTYTMMYNKKKISCFIVSQYRKLLSRMINTKPRRLCKELGLFNKKSDKTKRDLIKKSEKSENERRKIVEENKEILRQKRKFEYLLSQTELFSQFMLGKKDICSFKEEIVDGDLCDINKKFRVAAFKAKEEVVSIKSQSENQQLEQPKLLKCELKNYQIIGFNWLAKLYNQGINGILADDMGLGKTVQSIALLTYLAETEDIWGPFLVVTPVSTLHNWESEIKRFAPRFKILNYWGNSTYRSSARHEIKHANVVLTSYQIAVTDFKMLKKITWKYMILDEAQAIKSSASKRWTTLLLFKTKSRLLLTGTPVQNTMSELWALLHFIMPTLFDSLSEFTEWFSKGIEESAERKKAVDEIQLQKLHAILKPFMLRRLKSDIKTELGEKKEVDVYCELSVRQKLSYRSIIEACKSYEMENIMMQLRKVCNHPDLFEKLEATTKMSLLRCENETQIVQLGRSKINFKIPNLVNKFVKEKEFKNEFLWNFIRKDKNEAFFNEKCIFDLKLKSINNSASSSEYCLGKYKNSLHKMVHQNLDNVFYKLKSVTNITKRVVSAFPYVYTNNGEYRKVRDSSLNYTINNIVNIPPLNTFIQDSGKLVLLDSLLTELKKDNHRVLVYFQMTKMMDLMEDYLVKKEYSYCRLDGSSKISLRRDTVNDWQTGDKFVFLLSTRAGGLGINLTAADTVIFYDSDWNPTVDQQAMDRAYRIGQTKDVTVYRLITKDTIEERVMEKANTKGNLQRMVIKGDVFGGFDYL